MEPIVIVLITLCVLFALASVYILIYCRSSLLKRKNAAKRLVECVADYHFSWRSDLSRIFFDERTAELIHECGYKADKSFLLSVFGNGSSSGITLSVNALKESGVLSRLTSSDGGTRLVRWSSQIVHSENSVPFIVTIGKDITEESELRTSYKNLEQKYREETECMKLARKNADCGIITMSCENNDILIRFIDCEKLIGIADEKALTIDDFAKFVSSDEAQSVQHSINSFMLGSNSFLQLETTMKVTDGVLHHFLIRCGKSAEAYDDMPDVIGTIIDVTNLRGRKTAENSGDIIDRLTELYNRDGFMQKGAEYLDQCKKENLSCALICIQIERLQSIMTLFGIDAADMLIRAYAEAIVKTAGSDSVAGKVGVEDFAVLLKRGSAEEVDVVLKELTIIIENSCNNKYLPTVMREQTRFRAGTCFYDHIDDITTLYNKASVTLFACSRYNGKTGCYFNADIEEKFTERDIVEHEIGEALKHDELELYYQPKISLHNGEIVGVEALMRWNRGNHGLLVPEDFIHVAEEIGVITKMDEWGLKQACLQNKIWQRMGYKPIKISVNMSQAQLYQTDVVGIISSVLEETGLDPQYLEVEITETMAIIDIERTVSVLKNIRSLGISISMDDFGTGYSSLSSLKTLPIDTLKIDKSLVYDIETNETARHISKAILDLGKAMKLHILAEGVETEGQRDILTLLGCDAVQGFLYSRPQPAAVIERVFLIPLMKKNGKDSEKDD